MELGHRHRSSVVLGVAGLVPVLLSVALVVALGAGVTSAPPAPLSRLLVGSAVLATLAMLLAAPLGLLTAVHVVEFAGDDERGVIEALLAIFAVIPSVVWVYLTIEIVPDSMLGPGLASAVLALAVTPIIALGCIAALDAVPIELREGAWALGAGRAQAVLTIVIPSAGRALGAAVVFGLVRVLGELVIVAMLADRFFTTGFRPGAAIETLQGFVARTAASSSSTSLVLATILLVVLVAALGLLRQFLMPRRPG